MRQSKPASAKRPVGRPTGKRTDKEHYGQHSVRLSHEVQSEVLRALVLPSGKRYEFSKLVEFLLREWLDGGAKLTKLPKE